MDVWEHYKMDTRASKELEDEIKRLSLSYTPEWNFTTEYPDAGSVIALIFARQMAENIRCYNLMLDKYHTEFADLFGMYPVPVQPAYGIVVLDIFEDAEHGVDIKAGTKFLADSVKGEETQLVFTSCHDVHATHAKLTELLLVSEKEGKYIPLKKVWNVQPLIGKHDFLPESEDFDYPFRMFDSQREGIDTNAFILYHSFGMDVRKETLCLELQGRYLPKVFAAQLCDKKNYRFSYYTSQGLKPVEEVWQEENHICLKKQLPHQKIHIGQEEYTALVIQRLTPLKETIWADSVTFFPKASRQKPDFICNDNGDIDIEHAAIFGQELSVFETCYLGQDIVFEKKGAQIDFSFTLYFQENVLYASVPKEVEQLPIIKRRGKNLQRVQQAVVMVQEITFSYYNGIGWRCLPCEAEIKHLCSMEENTGIYHVCFLCPLDWEPVIIGSYEQRCIRMLVTRADNCYFRPARHLYPVLKDISFSYEYKESLLPQRMEVRCNMEQYDVTQRMKENNKIPMFMKFPWEGESLLLGLNQKPEKGPVSLYFILQSHINFQGMDLKYEYSTGEGFLPLKVIDGTKGLANSGNLVWMLPKDMKKLKIAGKECFWIRITGKKTGVDYTYFPVIQNIFLNAVEVWNVETKTEEEYYLEHINADMSFALHGKNILSADVWVNERNQFSRDQMLQLLQEMPDKFQAEYNTYGEIEAFYAKWEEVQNFDFSTSRDRHYRIDRTVNKLIFGDGISVQIPRVLQDTAFKVTLHTSNGKAGNVDSGAIHDMFSRQIYIKEIKNPLPSVGGSGLEENSRVRERAKSWFSSRKRLVSELDYIREVFNFSDSIDKVRCIPGRRINGQEDERCITIVLLMKEFEEGNLAFYKIRDRLKDYLSAQCEINCTTDEIEIVEPIFVKMTINLWVSLKKIEQFMEIQEEIKGQIRDFLNPLTTEHSQGREIGTLPKETQIQMLLNAIRTEACIFKFAVTLSYVDHNGSHETDLSKVQEMPFAVCINGEHQVHIAEDER